MTKVKENTLRKVEDFFARETALRGNSQIQVKLDDVKRETKLSLVTIYKALADLVYEGKLEILEGGSRRSPKTYRYLADFVAEVNPPTPMDLGGFSKVVEDLLRQLQLKDEVIHTLREKLAQLEKKESKILYKLKLADNTEVIVRKD